MNGFNTQLINPISSTTATINPMYQNSASNSVRFNSSSTITRSINGTIVIIPIDKTLTSRFHFNWR